MVVGKADNFLYVDEFHPLRYRFLMQLLFIQKQKSLFQIMLLHT